MTLKLTSQERETIKPFHSPIEAKTLNCPPNIPSHPSTHPLPSKSLSIVNTDTHKRDRRYKNKTKNVHRANSGKKRKPYEPVSIEDIEQAIIEVETKARQEERAIQHRRRDPRVRPQKHRCDVRRQPEKPFKRNRRIFDSGTTSTIVRDPLTISGTVFPLEDDLRVVGGGHVDIVGEGRDSKLGKVLIVPSALEDLISTSQDDRMGFHTIFGNGIVTVRDEAPIQRGRIFRQGKMINRTYVEDKEEGIEYYEGLDNDDEERASSADKDGNYSWVTQRLLHSMIGPHAGLARMNKTLKMADGLPKTPFKEWKFLCPGCVIGKMKTPPVPMKEVHRAAPATLPSKHTGGTVIICFDIVECSRKVPSWQGNRYTTFFKDKDSEMT